MLSEFCPDGKDRCGTSGVYVWAMGKIDVITYTYVIMNDKTQLVFFKMTPNKYIFIWFTLFCQTTIDDTC